MLLLLRIILVLLIVRALWWLYVGIRRGLSERGGGARGVPGVALSRDPVCGTYVVPGRALALREGGLVRYFCSERCRDEFARLPRGPE